MRQHGAARGVGAARGAVEFRRRRARRAAPDLRREATSRRPNLLDKFAAVETRRAPRKGWDFVLGNVVLAGATPPSPTG